MRSTFAILVIASFFGISSARYGCKNPQGQDVDWWVAYKIPGYTPGGGKMISEGYGHYYIDSTNAPGGWVKSTVSLLSDSGHAVSETLKQLYLAQKAAGEVWISMYNDAWPVPAGAEEQTTFEYAHMKGNMAFDKEGGYWMVHSVPKFPPKDKYEWVQTARRYGQSFLCMTFNYDQLKEIAIQLRYDQPWSYYTKLTPGIEAEIPDLRKIINLDFITVKPFTRTACVVSKGGTRFTIFAKGPGWKYDRPDRIADIFYVGIAATLKQKLHAQTWINNGNNLPSWCSKDYEVHNITSIKFSDGVTFPTENDHSKWCVADDCVKKPLVCIGDINRQSGQYGRGGGLVCFENPDVCKAYKSVIENTVGCDSSATLPKIDTQPIIDQQCPVQTVDPNCALNLASAKTYWCKKNPAFINSKCPGFCS